jgi:hypothetical protein
MKTIFGQPLDWAETEPRSLEYPYTRNYDSNIMAFSNFNVVSYSLVNLLKNNKLGMGQYTYQEIQKAPWGLTNLESFDVWKVYLKKSFWYSSVNFWSDVEIYGLYKVVTGVIDGLISDNNSHLKKIY